MTGPGPQPPIGLLLVDKPAGVTSHDVVGRVRAILGTRRVGHAGTLDPMATGLLVIAVGRATKLLGHLALKSKTYSATIRLGESTTTDDAEGELVAARDATSLTDAEVSAAMAGLTGTIDQVPSSYSAIKVDGRRAYDRARAGEEVALAARTVTVSRFDITGVPRRIEAVVDLDVLVECTTGTYVRALARDLGDRLGVGGHLTALRRHTVGPFRVDDAVDVFPDGVTPRGVPRPPIDEALRARTVAAVIDPSDAVATAFAVRTVTDAQAADLRFGRPLDAVGIDGVYAAVDAAGGFLALLAEDGESARPVLVWQAH